MNVLCFLVVFSFIISGLLTPLVRNAFRRWGLVDRPDDPRKQHSVAVPRVGGIPIALSYAAAFGLLLLFAHGDGRIVSTHMNVVWRLLPAAGGIFLVGLIDDIFGLKAWHKLLAQFAAASGAYWAGVRILGVDHTEHWWSLPLTLLWLAACTNAFNLIDGMDGLAAGLGFLATSTMVLEALIQGNYALAVATVPLAGSLLAFLLYNFNPASIFLGDCGSLLIGFLLGCFGVIWSQKSATILGMTAPLLAMTVPVLDVVLSIARRFLGKTPIFGADSGHVHHRLLAMGMGPKNVALLLYGVCGLGAVCSLLQSVPSIRFGGAAIVLFCGLVWVGVSRLQYVEFGVAHRMVMTGEFRRLLKANIRLEMFHAAVARSSAVEECWPIICDTCQEFGFISIEMHVGGASYEKTFSPGMYYGRAGDDWTVRIELKGNDYAIVRHPLDARMQSMIIIPFLEAMHGILLGKQQAAAEAAALETLAAQQAAAEREAQADRDALAACEALAAEEALAAKEAHAARRAIAAKEALAAQASESFGGRASV